MRALVTGSVGFVGRYMHRHLNGRGYVVDCLDIATGPGGECRDWFDWDDGTHYDLVVHCAAVVGGRTMIDGQPLLLACEDLSIDAALFRWALRARPGRIVYFSSSAAYPVALQGGHGRPLCEDDIGPVSWVDPVDPTPDQTYGWVKLTGERLAAEANAAGIRTHVFRPFSGYGGDQALDYPFPSFIERGIRQSETFHVWGVGDSARDWIHIDDVVGAVLAAIDQDVLGPVNICTGRATTFDELANLVMAQCGYSAPIFHDYKAPQGVHWRVGDPTKMHEFYRPRVTLEEGIARAVAGRVAV